jgi:outer membrane biosynthesis protein TonB
MKRIIKYLAFVSLAFLIIVSFVALSHGQTRQRTKKTVVVIRQKPKINNISEQDKNLEECLGCSNKPKPDIYQTNPKTEQKYIVSDCGSVTLKPIFQPKPKYPKAARVVKASGLVRVDVVFNETGNVIWAKIIEGHPLLRNETLRIVCLTRIKPPVDCFGKFTKLNSIISYDFRL